MNSKIIERAQELLKNMPSFLLILADLEDGDFIELVRAELKERGLSQEEREEQRDRRGF